MSASLDNESEILLGNKQLLAVFAVVAILLAVAFTGGYMLGKSSTDKKAVDVPIAAATEASGGPITQKLVPDDGSSARVTDGKSTDTKAADSAPEPLAADEPASSQPAPAPTSPAPTAPTAPKPTAAKPIVPRSGQAFVQVAAVARQDAEGIADVLRQHKFAARIAPAPADPTLFRVLVGPAKDPADLRNTQDALRKIGYTKCFVQHY